MFGDVEPSWMNAAWGYIGTAEVPGTGSNPLIERFHAITSGGSAPDDVPWCSSFVGLCLEESGIMSTRSKMARSYLGWGHDLVSPQFGAVAVLDRASAQNPNGGHVGFLVSLTDKRVILLGGNQGNRVCLTDYPRSKLLSLRWPSTWAEQR